MQSESIANQSAPADLDRRLNYIPMQLRRSFLLVVFANLATIALFGIITTALMPQSKIAAGYTVESAGAIMSAAVTGSMLLLAAWAVFAVERWLCRLLAAAVGLFLLVVASGFDYYGGHRQQAALGCFWLCLTLFVVARSWWGISIVWQQDYHSRRRAKQFRIRDLAGVTVTIAVFLAWLWAIEIIPDFDTQIAATHLQWLAGAFAPATLGLASLLPFLVPSRSTWTRAVWSIAIGLNVIVVYVVACLTFAYARNLPWTFGAYMAFKLVLFHSFFVAWLLANSVGFKMAGLHICYATKQLE